MIRKTIVLVLLVATLGSLVVGLVSYRRGIPGDELWLSSLIKEPKLQVAVVDGVVHAVYSRPMATQGPGPGDTESRFADFYIRRHQLGLVVASGVGGPFWAASIIFAIYPTLTFVRGPLRRRKRRRRNQCIYCGYSLQGLNEPRCPECGSTFTAKT